MLRVFNVYMYACLYVHAYVHTCKYPISSVVHTYVPYCNGVKYLGIKIFQFLLNRKYFPADTRTGIRKFLIQPQKFFDNYSSN